MAAPTVDEEREETNKEKCQIKAGAAFAHVKKAWNLLKDRHKKDIRTAGFGSIENCKITGSICRPLAAHIYDNLDTESMRITFGDGTEDKKSRLPRKLPTRCLDTQTAHKGQHQGQRLAQLR